jgi:phage terminase large subunit-like protein
MMDVLNVHGAIIDELHAHKTRNVVDGLDIATEARQPLRLEITTAGYDRHSICFEHHDYSLKALQGIVRDDAWFAFRWRRRGRRLDRSQGLAQGQLEFRDLAQGG